MKRIKKKERSIRDKQKRENERIRRKTEKVNFGMKEIGKVTEENNCGHKENQRDKKGKNK